jgi:hypothetical protein
MSEAARFVLRAIQEWGQADEERIKAVQGVLDAAGFDAKATCWPVFGGIWPKVAEGPEGEAASAWLRELTESMPRGKYEWEVEHVEKAIKARRSA